MATLHVHAAEFSMDSVICGHHVYRHIWSSVVGEELECRIETGNVHDLYAVSVIKSGSSGNDVVGHIPRNISTPYNLFLRKGGTVSCVVTGHHQYSSDLPQGGLEVPCQLLFKGTMKLIIYSISFLLRPSLLLVKLLCKCTKYFRCSYSCMC